MNFVALTAVAALLGGTAQPALPAPTGSYGVGVTSVRLVDSARPDPLGDVPFREVMVDVRYPTTRAVGERVPQFEPGVAEAFGDLAGRYNYGVEPGAFDWAATRTHAYRDAPVAPGGPRPVVLYSPGLGDARGWNASLVDDLVSHGYVVVTMDHTYESSGVRFPDGRVERSVVFSREPTVGLLRTLLDTRVADTRLVLDRLPRLLPGRLDLGRVAMVGHSAGGFAAIQAMHDDPRLRGAVDFDGQLSFGFEDDGTNLSEAARRGVRAPFLLVSGEPPKPSWRALLANSPGYGEVVVESGASHGSFTDAEALLWGDEQGLVNGHQVLVRDFLGRVLR